MLTPLAQLFITERHRPRAGVVGHSVPLASEIDVVDRALDPVLITSTRGTFLESRVSRMGYVRFGFSECPLEREGALVLELHRQLVRCAEAKGWDCVAACPADAAARMRMKGETPFHLVAGPWLEEEEVGGARVLDVGLPSGIALLVTSPVRAGLYTRIGDHVGVIAHCVDRYFVAVVL